MTTLIDNPDLVEDYASFVERMVSPKIKQRGRLGMLMYFAAKAVEEAVEFQSILTKYEYHGLEYEPARLEDEAGDMRFYNQAICNALGLPASMIEAMNKAKLEQRGEYVDHIAALNDRQRQSEGALAILADQGWVWDLGRWVRPYPDDRGSDA